MKVKHENRKNFPEFINVHAHANIYTALRSKDNQTEIRIISTSENDEPIKSLAKKLRATNEWELPSRPIKGLGYTIYAKTSDDLFVSISTHYTECPTKGVFKELRKELTSILKPL